MRLLENAETDLRRIRQLLEVMSDAELEDPDVDTDDGSHHN